MCISLVISDELFGWMLFPALAAAPVLVGEIIGIIIREVKGKPMADIIAVFIADGVTAVVLAIIIIIDFNSSGWFAGLIAIVILVSMAPVTVASAIVAAVQMGLRKKQAKGANYERN